MKAKQSLGARIRGWFPEAPKGLKLSFAAKNPIKQGNFKNAQEQVSPVINAMWLALTLLAIYVLSLDAHLFLMLDYYAVMLIGVVIIGAFLGIVPAYKVLKTLSKGGKTRTDFSEIISFAFLLILIIIVIYISASTSQWWIRSQYMSIYLSGTIAIFDSRAVLFIFWERKNNCKIWRGKKISIFITPKNNQSSSFSQNNQNGELKA